MARRRPGCIPHIEIGIVSTNSTTDSLRSQITALVTQNDVHRASASDPRNESPFPPPSLHLSMCPRPSEVDPTRSDYCEHIVLLYMVACRVSPQAWRCRTSGVCYRVLSHCAFCYNEVTPDFANVKAFCFVCVWSRRGVMCASGDTKPNRVACSGVSLYMSIVRS